MFPSWSKPNVLFLGSFLLDLLIFFFYFSIAAPSVTSVSSLNPGDYIFLVLIPKSLTIFYTTMRSSIISSKTYSRKPQHLRKEKEKREILLDTISHPYTMVPHLWIQTITDRKYFLKFQEAPKSKNRTCLLQATIYIAFTLH